MSSVLGGGSNATQSTAIGSLQFSTSQQGGVIPLVYGTTRVACNLLDYQDFTATPASAGGAKGKGGVTGKSNGQFTYTASIVMGICQGPAVAFGLVWYNKSISPLPDMPGLSFMALGADGQDADPFWIASHGAGRDRLFGNVLVQRRQLHARHVADPAEFLGRGAGGGSRQCGQPGRRQPGRDCDRFSDQSALRRRVPGGASRQPRRLPGLLRRGRDLSGADDRPAIGGAAVSRRPGQADQQRDRLDRVDAEDRPLRRSAARHLLCAGQDQRRHRRTRHADTDISPRPDCRARRSRSTIRRSRPT